MTRADGEIRLFGTRGSPRPTPSATFCTGAISRSSWVELNGDEQARNEAAVGELGDERLPVCIFSDGTRLERPTVRQVIEKLGWFQQSVTHRNTMSASTARGRRV